MVVVRVTVDLVDGDVEFIRAFHQIQALDREPRLGVAEDPFALELFNARVRAVAADAFRVEEPDPDHEVLDLHGGPQGNADGERLPAVEHVPRLSIGAAQVHVRDLDFP